MDDKALLSLLADDAPAPGPSLADSVIATGRRTRRRRRLTVVASAAACTALAAFLLPVAYTALPSQQQADSTAAGQSYSRNEDGSGGAPAAVPEAYTTDPDAAERPETTAGGPTPPGAATSSESAVPQSSADVLLDLADLADLGAAYAAAFRTVGDADPDRLVVLDRRCPVNAPCTTDPLPGTLKKSLRTTFPTLTFTTRETPGALRLDLPTGTPDALHIPVNGTPVPVHRTPANTWTPTP
ncbi:hypothetical protein LO762_12720 [Actinocorallia sp. API 0066]|uniref:hypothetical protein n=1 Tax=Actinocorallia sp. API 0066 TaxID=2896846 RepID=UPI001E597771|nr:hypothetical protein [Actinocorallia sp. API 0066]MCD0450049.1 hypothetical protein [Actinocorallia sp. API 0066]